MLVLRDHEAIVSPSSSGGLGFGVQGSAIGQIERDFTAHQLTKDIASLMRGKRFSVVEALEHLQSQPAYQHLAPTIGVLRNSMNDGGRMFSEAIALHPQFFSPAYVELMRAAELEGAVREMFTIIAAHPALTVIERRGLGQEERLHEGHLALFCGHLLASGRPIIKVFCLARDLFREQPEYTAAFDDIVESLVKGFSIHIPMKDYPHLFNEKLVGVIREGEMIGALGQALIAYAEDSLEKKVFA